MRVARLTAGLLLAGLLSGCGALAGGAGATASGQRAPTASGPVTAATDPNTPALVAQRAEAGLPDCEPPTGQAVPPQQYGLPDLVLPCLGSTRSVNLSQLRGRPLVVNLWAQWCGPCRGEAPAFADLAKRAGGRVTVIGVDFDDPDPGAAIAFAAASGWTYPHLVDAAADLRKVMALSGIPVTILVDADGRVVYRKTGAMASEAELIGLIRDHLGVRL